jgi:PTS system nitrogen regulatory IIA component
MYSSSTASVSALSLHSLLVREHILIGLCATSKKRVFEEIGFLFEKTAKLNRQLITDSLFARERLGSTGLGHGVAIPHGRIKGLKEPQLAFVQLESPIGFDAIDDAPVSVMFILLVPENATQKHLDLLSEIASLMSHESNRDALKTIVSAEALLALIHKEVQS